MSGDFLMVTISTCTNIRSLSLSLCAQLMPYSSSSLSLLGPAIKESKAGLRENMADDDGRQIKSPQKKENGNF